MTVLTVTLCGSLTRAAHDLAHVHRALALAGHLVHAPVPPLPGEPPATAGQIERLTDRHYAAINDSQLVIGVAADGRPSNTTITEMRYAVALVGRTRWVLNPANLDALLADIAAGRLLDRAEVKP